MRKTYNIKATVLVDLEWEVDAEDEHEALSKFYARDIKEVIDDALILDVNSENEEVELKEGTFIIKTKEISYDISYGDLAEFVEEQHPEVEPDTDEFDDLVEKAIEETRNDLPQEMTLEINCEKADLDDYVADKISEETGWLINYCDYEIVGVK
jgi:hypothetical protein